MSTSYLQLVNRVLKALNEVELTSATFGTAMGFHADVKESVNAAIVDVYTEENNEWPFSWTEITTNTTVGTVKYTTSTSLSTVDWESFRLQKPQIVVASITQTAGIATVTTATDHLLLTGDNASIYGADQAAYNGEHSITKTGATTFTFTVDSSTTSPATGTIFVYPPWDEEYLEFMPYDQYRMEHMESDRNTINPEQFSKPRRVVRTIDNNFIVTPKPDRVYPIVYEGSLIPAPLSAYNDVTSIPDNYIQMVVDKALHYAYMFRDNLEQANYVEDRYRSNVNKNRRILVDKSIYMRFE